MCEKTTAAAVIMKEFLTKKDSEEIKNLMELCYSKDQINLKLELDYKQTVKKHSGPELKGINEFMYYVDGNLVSYLGICNFGGNVLELNGMTHPEYRKKGLFQRLFQLAVMEAKNGGHKSLLLLSDEKSEAGNRFIKETGASYKTSEFRMKLFEKPETDSLQFTLNPDITLKTADKSDLKEIARQNALHFNTTEESEALLLDEAMLQEGMYMVQLNGETIGKINVEYDENSAFIYGFGILPEYRRKGYGKAAFQALLYIIKGKGPLDILLDVESKNRNALNLYKTFGFEEMSVMNYYEYMI